MSLAAITTNSLTIIDGSSLKRHATSYDFQKTPVLVTPRAHVWSTDNSALYLVSSATIHSFSPTSCTFTSLYNSPQGTSLQPVLALKDKSTLIIAQGSAIHLFSVSSTPQIISTLIGHSAPVTSLSVSNDASLLASSSTSGTLCVHNLAHNSLTVLKGISTTPGLSSKTLVCMFHPHTRTRLLVGCGKTLFVYDTTLPSGPLRSIVLSQKDSTGTVPNIGNIVAISCSPFSKTLITVAFNSGFIALVDLEKDRPFFKSLRLKVQLTSLTFTADGTSLAVGTESGKVIVQDLRAMEHDHRTLNVCDEGKGERIIGLSIQRRTKTSPSTSFVAASKPTTNAVTLPKSLSVPLAHYDLNNNSGAIMKSTARRIVSSSPNATTGVKTVTPTENRLTNDELPKRTLSPPNVAATKDGGESLSSESRLSIQNDTTSFSVVQIDTLIGSAKVVHKKKKVEANTEKNQRSASRSRLSESRTTPSSALRVASVGSKTKPTPNIIAHDRPSSRSSITPHTRSAKTPVISPTLPAGGAEPIGISSTTSLDSVVEQSAKHPARTIRAPEAEPRNIFRQVSGLDPSVSSQHNRRINSTSASHVSRTPTPDLPPVDEDPLLVWRGAAKNLNVAFSTLEALSTPGIERWVEAGEKPAFSANTGGKYVGWADSDGNVSTHETDGDEPTTFATCKEGTNQPEIQSTSSHPAATSMSPLQRPHIPPTALQISPLRSPPLRVSTEGTNVTESGGAQELLRAVVRDVMYDHRQETREDIKGLHLDLLRMGRSWKTELRSLMDEYIGDLRELRKENVKLRKENEQLRRGF